MSKALKMAAAPGHHDGGLGAGVQPLHQPATQGGEGFGDGFSARQSLVDVAAVGAHGEIGAGGAHHDGADIAVGFKFVQSRQSFYQKAFAESVDRGMVEGDDPDSSITAQFHLCVLHDPFLLSKGFLVPRLGWFDCSILYHGMQ